MTASEDIRRGCRYEALWGSMIEREKEQKPVKAGRSSWLMHLPPSATSVHWGGGGWPDTT